MNRTIYRLGIACLASLPMTLGCVSSGSSAPAARAVNPTPVARSGPKTELVLPETVTTELGAVYFDTDLHRALRLKAAETDRSVSDLVNEAVKYSLAEDAEDLESFDNRAREPAVTYEDVVKDLKRREKI